MCTAARSTFVAIVLLIVVSMIVRDGYSDDLAKTDRWWTETDVRHIEVAIRAERHRRRKKQPGRDLLDVTVPVDSEHLSRTRRRKRVSRRVLEDVQAVAAIKRQADDSGQTRANGFYAARFRDPQNHGAAVHDRKGVGVADGKAAARVGIRGRTLPAVADVRWEHLRQIDDAL